MARKVNTQKQKAFLSALRTTLGVIKEAAIKAKVDRSTVYGWKEKDPDFLEAFNQVQEESIDFVESAMFEEIGEKRNAYLIWKFLSTRGKSRGYTEKTEIDVTAIPPVYFVGSDPKEDEDIIKKYEDKLEGKY